MNANASGLCGLSGERVALCDVAVTAVLADLLGEVSITQTYRNDERTNIEAVYTFPLPLDAVLLSLDVALGGKRLKGVVVEKTEAEERYEDAIGEGDAAVMLQNPEPGLYTMNVGNLLAGETATITVRYALLHRWTGDGLRFYLPTTIAPRYGHSPLEPHQTPEASITVENKFSLRVEVLGALRDARFECPTHAVNLARTEDKLMLSLEQARAVMDRDFVLNVRSPRSERNFVMTGRDGDGVTAIASFQPFFPGLEVRSPLDLVVVVDCSGSMAGESIMQAKRALETIVERLEPRDSIGVVAFGSTTRKMSRAPLRCTPANLERARRFVSELDADLGGTEIGAGLEAAYAVRAGERGPDVFLITDGEVGDWQPVVRRAREAARRIFTVGVGSAVSEAFVRQLASATGGECELVTPGEGMAERVVRHFERMRAPRAESVVVRWPDGAVDLHPAELGAVFEGDTVIASARFPSRAASGDVTLEVHLASGAVARQVLSLSTASTLEDSQEPSTIARVAAARRMAGLDENRARAAAVRYQLVGPHTHWLVVAERAEGEKAQHLPVLRKVPQTMAAGWGGMGSARRALAIPRLATPRVSVADHVLSDARPLAHFIDPYVPFYDVPARPIRHRGRDKVLSYEDVRDLPAGDQPLSFDIERLLEVVGENPLAATSRTAFEALHRAGYLPLFAAVWERAEASGIAFTDAAAIVLDRLLRPRFERGLLDHETARVVIGLAMDAEALARRIGPDLVDELRRLADQAVLDAQARAAESEVT